MPVQVETMALRAKWEQTSRWLDELPKTTSGMVGVVVFLGAGLLIMRLPTWGFVMGLLGLLAMLCWLALSGQPVVKLTWPSKPLPALEPLPTPTTAPKPDEPTQRVLINELLAMVELPGGEFWMGSPESEPDRYRDETRHRVRVSPFAMAKVPVTQKLYQEVMEQSPSQYEGESLPVETVDWFDAVRFCNKLSERVGLRPCYRIVEPKQGNEKPADGDEAQAEAQPEVEWDQSADGYRLPTEAEWEYACRAGTKTAYSFGDDPAQLGEYAWFDGNSENRTHEVGTKKPNGWGLSDLHGNVWEWCWDWYAEYQVTDDNEKSVSLVCPIGPPSGVGRVLRGGSFGGEPGNLRSANRFRYVPTFRGRLRGFRCVRGSERQR